jgi:two-component system sensor histidine kinase/response regulator
MIIFDDRITNCVTNNSKFSIQKLLQLGIREDTSFIETQKTYMFNLFLLIASPFAVLSLAMNIFAQAFLPALFNLVQLCVFALCFWISKMQKGLHLRPLLLLILSVVAIIAAYFYKNGSEYRLLVMMIAAVVIFDRSWQFLLFSAMVSIAFVWIRLDDQSLADDPHEGVVGGILKMLLPLFLFAMSLFYFKHIYFRNLAQLEKANQDLSLAKQQKERILNTVAHDLRSPINNIAGISQLMLGDKNLSPDLKELVSMVVHATESSQSLILGLLQSNAPLDYPSVNRKINLVVFIEECVSLLRLTAVDKGIQIKTAYSGREIIVSIDTNRIERVLTNLVNNAIKFSTVNSVVSITVNKDIKRCGNPVLLIKALAYPKKITIRYLICSPTQDVKEPPAKQVLAWGSLFANRLLKNTKEPLQ